MSGYSGADIRGTDLPNISALAATGSQYARAWSGEFPTSPTTLAASLATGAFPRRHGLLGDEWEDPKKHVVVAPTTRAQTLTGSIDQLLEPRGVASTASLLKEERPNARILAVGGSNCSTASAAATWAADYVICARRAHDRWAPIAVAGHELPTGTLASQLEVPATHGQGLAPRLEGWRLEGQDNWVTRTAVAAMQKIHPAITIITFPEPDLIGEYVASTERGRIMRTLLRGIDRNIGQVVRATHRMKSYNNTVFGVVSMRGFEPTSTTVSTAKLTRAVVGTGTFTRYIWSDGAAMLGLSDSSLAQAAAQVIGSTRVKGLDAVYFKTGGTYEAQYINPDMPVGVAKAQVYLLGSVASPGSPQVVVAFGPHMGTQDGRLAGLRRTATGVGMQWGNQQAFVLLSGHGILRGIRSSYPARLVDVAPTIEALLGLRHPRQDGIVLADSVFRAPKSEARREAASGVAWSRYLTALRNWDQHAGP